MKKLTLLALSSLLFACPPRTGSECLAGDAGTTEGIDAGPPTNEMQIRLVNLGRESVTVTFDGTDGGIETVLSMGTLYKTGRVTLIKQRGVVTARNLDLDGGSVPLTLPFEFDSRTTDEATFVIRDLTPARISTDLTLDRQLFKPTYGENVRASLKDVEVVGGVDIEGDCAADIGGSGLARVSLRDETLTSCLNTNDAYYARPIVVPADATPYFVHSNDDGLNVAWVSKVNQGLRAAGGALARGSSLLVNSSPGTVSVSGPTRQLYILNAHSTMKLAGVDINGILLVQDLPGATLIRVLPNMIATAARIATPRSMARTLIDGQTQMLPLGAVLTGPCRPPYLCDFLNNEDTLLVVSDASPTSVSVLKSEPGMYATGARRPVVFGTTSIVESKGCVSVLPNDDQCTMGAAAVSSVGNLAGGAGGGAAAASYARAGRFLYPPKVVPGGSVMRFDVEENAIILRRFIFDNPPGLTPTATRIPGGFAIVAPVGAVDPRFADKRALLFVDTTVQPWALVTSISR